MTHNLDNLQCGIQVRTDKEVSMRHVYVEVMWVSQLFQSHGLADVTCNHFALH